ncbi:Alpha-galactosidase [Glycine soja]
MRGLNKVATKPKMRIPSKKATTVFNWRFYQYLTEWELLFGGTDLPAMMKCFSVSLASLWVLLALFSLSVSSQNISESGLQQASLPPRGWNSYDSFCWTISEDEFLQSAEMVSQRLKAHGYQFVVVDYLWYRKKVKGAYPDSLGFDVIDEWGRMIPDPGRWPSSIGGKGFSEVANKVHSLGLKFGIHVMRGISTQAVNANTPILDITKGGAYQESGRVWHAKDIAMPERACAWMPHGFMSVNTKLGAGRAFLKSLYEQYAAWGVDLVKHDCVFGDDLDLNEISYVSEVLSVLNRPIVYSLSPGTSVTPAMAKDVSGLVNMYRITGDDWDKWEDVKAHFDVTRDFSTANMIGGKGLKGNSWPDLDMLPFGWLTDPGSNEGPHRFSKLTLEEKRTQFPYITSSINLKHPGGKERRLKKGIHSLGLTSCSESKARGWSIESLNQDLERICWKKGLENKHQAPFCVHKRELQFRLDGVSMYQEDYRGKHQLVATDRMKFCLDASPRRKVTSKDKLVTHAANVNSGGIRSWIATGRTGEIYLAFFNLSEQKTEIYAKTSYLAKVLPDKSITSCKGEEVWSGTDVITTQGTISMNVEIHGCALFVLNCN